jgi:predicted Rossmann fold flavoprotein
MSKKTTDEAIWDVVVVGGGPAGMMAAGCAAKRGKRVLLLEKNSSLGRKLLITGGGRCNVTNHKPDPRTLLPKYKGAEQFLYSAFSQFGVEDTLLFFKKHGMEVKEENEGRMFPVSNKARSVWDVLVGYINEHNVEIRVGSEVSKITKDETSGLMVVRLKGEGLVMAKACIVAAGGKVTWSQRGR